MEENNCYFDRQRNTGLDICRIISMIGIVLLHVVGAGGVLASVEGQYTISYWAAEWVFICAECSVDIFAVMSGYFGINKKKKTIYRAVELVAIVLFYSVIITLGFAVFAPTELKGVKGVLKGIFPPLVGRYWYITCFVPVLIFQPFINKMLLSLTEKQHLALLFSEVFVFSCIPSAVSVDFFRLDGGYSFVWLLLLYSIGAYLGRIKDRSIVNVKKCGVFIFFVLSLALLFGNICISKIVGANLRYMVAYTSPVVLAMSLCVLLPLSDIKLTTGRKILEVLSSTAFDVYLIHSHVLVYDLILTDAFTWIKTFSWYYIPAICVICAVSVFLLCSFLGYIREQLFRILRIKDFLIKISAPIDKLLYPW